MPHTADTHPMPLVRDTRDMRWQIAAGWESELLDSDGLRLDQWLASGQAQVVKRSPGRTIYRVDLPARHFYLKHYRGGLRERLRQWFRASAARREWQKSLELGRRAISTARPVGLGEPCRPVWMREQYFLSEEIPESKTLAAAIADGSLDCQTHPGRRRAVLAAVARFVAAAHRAGVVHDDLHAGNLLLSEGPRREPRLYLIDVPKVRFSGPLAWSESRDNLAMLYAGHLEQLSRTELTRFWSIYRQSRPELRLADPVTAGRELIQRAWRHARRTARSRDKRPLADNRDFYCLRRTTGKAYAVRQLPADELAGWLADCQQRLNQALDRPLKLTHGSVVVQSSLRLADGPVAIAYKRYRPKSWWKRLLARWRPSRARQSWIRGHALLARGIATPRPLMACVPSWRNEPGVSYLATAWITGALNLHTYAWRLAAGDEARRRTQTRRAARNLGRLIGRMHAWQISHDDLKGCNLLLADRDGEIEALIIDLDAVRWHRRLSRRRAIDNLARLAASVEAHRWLTRTDRLRFLKAYLGQAKLDRPDWRPWWRGVARRSAGITRRLEREHGVIA